MIMVGPESPYRLLYIGTLSMWKIYSLLLNKTTHGAPHVEHGKRSSFVFLKHERIRVVRACSQSHWTCYTAFTHLLLACGFLAFAVITEA
ncbi:hypothetical protein K503DRAFT_187234 [Rhizopogon vinicolor AM-OR11-026]|uniref:Uncharacterized protein n=1 Tax=Rhizopogon vinicolor AM-OR11-026 TaxID=1314800 RepID=A0A1B7MZK9_9AGAM|nr:hypothetical protein K503DRAFT_187234 [Rhizopogon vinicolor AM-OR11-026]